MTKEDLFSLSQTRRRLAHEYKRWALEDARAGKAERAAQCRKKSDELWQSAKSTLSYLRVWNFPAPIVIEWKEAAE